MNAVITGASKGIGRAIALKLASHGYNLAVCARNKDELDGLVAEIKAYPVQILSVVADCSRKADVMVFFEQVRSVMEQVDVLVNNAGIFLPGSLLDEADECFEQQQQLHVNATYYLSKNIGKMMRQARSGHIFNICSVAGIHVIENAGSYSVTKTAMRSLNHVLRKELAAHRVKVTAILPGATLTSSWTGTDIPADTFIQPEDIAQSLYSILTLSSGANVDELILTPLQFND